MRWRRSCVCARLSIDANTSRFCSSIWTSTRARIRLPTRDMRSDSNSIRSAVEVTEFIAGARRRSRKSENV